MQSAIDPPLVLLIVRVDSGDLVCRTFLSRPSNYEDGTRHENDRCHSQSERSHEADVEESCCYSDAHYHEDGTKNKSCRSIETTDVLFHINSMNGHQSIKDLEILHNIWPNTTQN